MYIPQWLIDSSTVLTALTDTNVTLYCIHVGAWGGIVVKALRY